MLLLFTKLKNRNSKWHYFRVILLSTFVFCNALTNSHSLWAEQTRSAREIRVWGSVKDAQGNPISGATVVVNIGNQGSLSDSIGNYIIKLQTEISDSLRIEASCLGFYTVKHDLKSRSERIDFVLREKTTALGDVVITAQRGVRRTKDVPEIVRLISRNEIAESQVQSLPDLLEMELPGLNFTSTEGSNNQVSLNGFGSKYVLFLIDGERMSGETSRENVDYNRIDIDQVERIEIVQGGMSTLYGSGAIAGVVNIITSKATLPWSANLNAKYNTEGEQKYSLSAGFKKNGFSSYTSGSYRRKSAYMMHNRDSMKRKYSDGSIVFEPIAPDMEVEGFYDYNVSQKFGYTYGKGEKAGSEIRVSGSFYEHERFNAYPIGELLHHLYRDGTAGLNWMHVFDSVHSIEISYSFDDYMKYNKYLTLGSEEKSYENVTHNPRLLYRGNFPYRNHFLLGAEVFYEKLSTYQFSGNEDHRQTGLWLYAQDDWQALEWLTISAGIRFEYYREHGFMAVPKLTLMAKTNGFTFRLGYASGFRTPTLKEMYTSWDHQGMFELIGNPYLKPEKSYNVSASAEYSATWWSIGINAHYHWLQDKIATVWNTRQDTAFYTNAEESQLSGVDIHTDWQLPLGFSLKAAYAYVYDIQLQNGVNVSSARPHSASMRLEYRYRWKNHGFSARLSGRYLSAMNVNVFDDAKKMWYGLRYEPYFLLNFGVSMQFPYGVKLSVGVDNMLNYKPRYATYNAYITRGVSFSFGLSWNMEALYSYREKKNER